MATRKTSAIGTDRDREEHGRTRTSADLTQREREILRYILDGATSREVAARLGISQRTVEAHRRHILKKTGAAQVTELGRS